MTLLEELAASSHPYMIINDVNLAHNLVLQEYGT